jgi:mannan endo-1,4-beta-mannosidase
MTKKNAYLWFIALLLATSCSLPFFSSRPGAETPGTSVPAATATPAPTTARPTDNKSSGFFVSGAKLYDSNGVEFRIQGVNANHWWNNGDDTLLTIPFIKAAGANAVRIVFGPTEDPAHPDYYICQTTAERQAVVEEYIKYKIVPIVEYHNATGSNNPGLVSQAADFWINEPWVKTYEKYVIVNITNEWGTEYTDDKGFTGSEELWRDAYLSAIAKIRNAGIRNTLIVDSLNYASTISPLQKYGQSIIEADAQRNILFSLHMYAGWRAPGDPDDDTNFYMNVDTGLDALAALGLPVIVGEFSHVCAIEGQWGDPEAAEDAQLIDAYDQRGTGWLFWMWYNSTGSYQNVVNDTASFLYTGIGLGLKPYLASAKEATCFPAAAIPTLPTPPVPNPDWAPEGPLTAVVSNSWWMSVSLPNMDDIAYITMESQDGKTLGLQKQWYGPFTVNVDLVDYLNEPVRFLIGASDGSTARTVYANLYYVDDPGTAEEELEETTTYAIAAKP